MGLTKNLGWLSKYITADSNGNIGVGTTSPASKLELIGNYRQKALVGNSEGFSLNINSGTDEVSLFNYYNAALTFGTNNTERMRITSGGNVGIGNISPTSAGGYATLSIGGSGSTKGQITWNSGATNIGYAYNDATNMTFGANNDLIFATTGSGTERMRITSGGNVGIGIIPQWTLATYKALEIGAVGLIYARESGASTTMVVGSNLYHNGIDWKYKVAGFGSLVAQNAGNITFETAPNGTAGSIATITERMRITQSGNLLLRTQTDSGYQCTINSTAGNLMYFTLGSGNVQMFMGSNSDFYISTANSQGVKLAVGATSWSAYSDIRLKNITSNIENALDSVDTLSAVRFTLKSDATNKPRVGLIAQEVQEVLPEAVDVDDKGMLSVRYTELIPLLVASIKELTERIKTLENK